MKILFLILASVLFFGCQDLPQDKWQAIERVEVYRNDDSFKILFYISPGEICRVSSQWEPTKAAGYKKVICDRGEGWVIDDRSFRRVD